MDKNQAENLLNFKLIFCSFNHHAGHFKFQMLTKTSFYALR